TRLAPSRTRFPYTTLFRSEAGVEADGRGEVPNGLLRFAPCGMSEATIVVGVRHFRVEADRRGTIGDGLVIRRAGRMGQGAVVERSEEHTSELQSRVDLVCR